MKKKYGKLPYCKTPYMNRGVGYRKDIMINMKPFYLFCKDTNNYLLAG